MTSPNDTEMTAAAALAENLARWRSAVELELKGAPFEKKLVTRTFEGIALQPLHTRSDLAAVRDLAAQPGEAPFRRGVRPAGYRAAPWEVAQEIAACDPAEFNAALLSDLQRGQNAVLLSPDSSTRAGVGISRLADLSAALADVALFALPVHLRAGADALPRAACYLALAQERAVAWTDLSGSVTADPLGAWMAEGSLACGLGSLYDSAAGWTTWAATHAPRLQTMEIDAELWGNAGATAVQELAFALAGATEYLRELSRRGVAPASLAPRLRFRFAIGPQFFTEVAKFRAFRSLWTRVVSAFGVAAELAAKAGVHAATATWNQTRLDPHVNLLRVTTEALSAVLGGCDGVQIAPFDAVSGATSEFSRRIARNVHTLLAEEFGFGQVADPAGGAWYVEKLTDDLARQAWLLFQTIEGKGGVAAGLRDGSLQASVAKAAREKDDALAKRRYGLVGTNLFPNLKETPLPCVARPAVAAAGRSRAKIPKLPAAAPWAARFEAALAAAREGATVAELAALSPSASAPETIVAVKPWRAAAPFEALRATTAAVAQRSGARPKVFLAKMGPSVQHKARADFSSGFFAVGGFEVLGRHAYETAAAAGEAAAASGASVAVLCSTDETYPALVPEFVRVAKAARPGLVVVLAGLPAEPAQVEVYRQAGIDDFIHVRANVPEFLAQLLKTIGAAA